MRDAAEPAPAANEPVKPTRTPTVRRMSTPNRPQSETATLVCAIVVAVLMGVACGAWINMRLASAVSPAAVTFVAPPAPAHLLPAAPAVETPPAPASNTSQLMELADGESTSANDSDGASEAPGTRTPASPVKEPGRPAAGTVKPSASEVGPATKIREESRTAKVAEAKSKAARGQGNSSPCALYASADALTLRGGGAATLVVGGPGEAGHVTVTTPDWSNIAVFSEGHTGGNGWLRYSVKSVGKKSGAYSVRFTTPCGSRNIRVTVVQP